MLKCIIVSGVVVAYVSANDNGFNDYKFAHASFMIVAYMLLFPIFVMVARYGKPIPGFESLNSFPYLPVETWKYHVCGMFLAVGCAWVGFAIAISLLEGGKSTHAAVGVALILLTTLQLFLGLVRLFIPKPCHSNLLGIIRAGVVGIHQCLGMAIIPLGWINIQLGMTLLAVHGTWDPVFYCWIAILAAVCVVLEVRKRRSLTTQQNELSFRRHQVHNQHHSPLATVSVDDDLL